jgi:environmental stress-induced protein Ves
MTERSYRSSPIAGATRIVAPGQHRSAPWRNGRGRTAEIAVAEADTPACFLWRASIAEVTADGPFSIFPHCDRTLMLTEGAGLELTFPARPPVRIDRPFAPADFPGDEAAECRLLRGPVRDVNIMVDRSRRADWRVIAADRAEARLEPSPLWLIHMLRGTAMLQVAGHHALTEGETAIVEEPETVPHLRAAEAGTYIYAVAIRPR